jgi:hypothetical protein
MARQTFEQAVDNILQHKIVVKLEQAVNGYWDGGAKDRFEFSPSVRRYSSGLPNIEWGSWGANFWFRVDVGPNSGNHLHNVKKMLTGMMTSRYCNTVTITIEKDEE